MALTRLYDGNSSAQPMRTRQPAGLAWPCPSCNPSAPYRFQLVTRDDGSVECATGCDVGAIFEATDARVSDDAISSRAHDNTVCTAYGPQCKPHPHPHPHPYATGFQGEENSAPDARGDAELKWVDGLIAQCREGSRRVLPVVMPPLPPGASPAMRDVANFFAEVSSLRQAEDEDRPVLFAGAWVAGHISRPHRTTANAIRKLRDAGWLVDAGDRKIPGRRIPAFLFAPLPLADGLTEVGRRGDVQPQDRGVDDPLVSGAEVAVSDGPLATAGHGTGDVHRIGRLTDSASWNPHGSNSPPHGGHIGARASHPADGEGT